MRRLALLVPLLLLPGCSGFLHFLDDTSGLTVRKNAPLGDSETMRRARGDTADLAPLLTQPGDVWPGPPPSQPTMQDLQRDQAITGQQATGSWDMNAGATDAGKGRHADKAALAAQDGTVVIPNDNGTSTVVTPDGNVKTISSSKP